MLGNKKKRKKGVNISIVDRNFWRIVFKNLETPQSQLAANQG